LKTLAQILFWLGILCIPLAWGTWYAAHGVQPLHSVMADIADPALAATLMEAHAERMGLWVAIWPVTLMVMSYIIDQKATNIKD
jgi:hypothetical protein